MRDEWADRYRIEPGDIGIEPGTWLLLAASAICLAGAAIGVAVWAIEFFLGAAIVAGCLAAAFAAGWLLMALILRAL